MTETTLMSVGKANQTMSSREIAELTGKEHRNVLRDCDKLNESYANMGLAQISADLYKDTYGRDQKCYSLTRMQTFDLMTGYNTELRIKVNRRWEELETKQQTLDFSNPETVLQLAQNWAESETKRKLAESKVLALEQINNDNKPKVLFADAVETSKSSILIGELAKILKQNGVEIGQNRLFEWLREKGYLISRKGTDYNMPTQKAMDLGLFDIKETAITHSDGHVSVNKTTKVKGKGQTYFINKFLKK